LWVDRNEVAVMVHGFRWAGDETETLPAEDAFANDMML